MNVIKIENLSKQYRLGVIGHGTLTHDLQSWWAKVRGKEDPNAKVNPLLEKQEEQIEGDFFWALRNVNIEVNHGEVLGIIGRNGAGKSTMLKILSKITAPSSGRILVKGRIASLLEVGTGFHPELTGRENIFLNGAILGMSKPEINRKLDEIIDFSGVEKYVDTPVKRYSSGMKVRLAFAVAAHLEPEILVIDEVLAVGDAEFQKKALGKVKQVTKSEGRTVLFVSHNMAAIENLCSKVCVIEKGRLRFLGDTYVGINEYMTSAELDKDSCKTSNAHVVNVTHCWFENKGHEKIDFVMSGQEVYVTVAYTSKFDDIKADFIVNIYSQDNVNLITLSTKLVSEEKILIKRNGKIRFRVGKLPLAKGVYRLEARIRSKENNLFYNDSNVGTMNVIEGDFFGTGKLTRSYRRGVLVEHSVIV